MGDSRDTYLMTELRRLADRWDRPVPVLLSAVHAKVCAALTREAAVPVVVRRGDTVERSTVTVRPGPWRELVDALAAPADATTTTTTPSLLLDLAPDREPVPACAPGADGPEVLVRWDPDGNGGPRGVPTVPGRAACQHADRVAGYHEAAARSLAGDPDGDHDRVELLSDAEIAVHLHAMAGPVVPIPETTFLPLFEENAATTPGAVAVVHRDEHLTYAELDTRANRVARGLLAAGLDTEDVVAVVADRNLDWAIALLGVLKAGGVYLPVRPDFPTHRIVTQLRRAECRFVVTDHAGAAAARPVIAELDDARAGVTIAVHTVAGLLDSYPDGTAPGIQIAPKQAAYVYFTSGSTGEPKGAVCEHGGMLNHLLAKVDDLALARGNVLAQLASQCFDISLWQLVAPLIVGGTVVVVDTDVQTDLEAFLRLLVTARVDIVQVVPAYLNVLLERAERAGRPDLGRLRIVAVTGEALATDLVRRWFAAFPHIPLVNCYGTTEASDDTMHEILTAPPEDGVVLVGRSLRNVHTSIVDEQLRLVPFGTVGEIVFSGLCVGRGYLNDPERTRHAFVLDPYRAGMRMYRTGDFGRWRPDGRIEFHGRIDEQVKIRGYRIEIGEVESTLLAVPAVRAAAVVVDRTGEQGNLAAFYCADEHVTVEQLTVALRATLPEYMVPTYFHRLDRLPSNENGKTDKRQLVELAATLGHADGSYVAPVTATERRIAVAWAEVLNVPVERIGKTDSFFALGGTSLAAVQLLVRLDRTVSLQQLTRHPELADLARAVDEHAATDRARPLHLLSPVVSPLATLVCLPDAGGNAVNFAGLAEHLRPYGIAVLGAELPGHDVAAAGGPMWDVATAAAAVRGQIRARPGPVLLWGQGTGGAIALEATRLLERQGREVSVVFLAGLLLDSADVLAARRDDVQGRDDADIIDELRAEAAYVEFDGLRDERSQQVAAALRHDVAAACEHLAALSADPDQYRISAPVHLVVAPDDPHTAGPDTRRDRWRTVTPELVVHELTGGGHHMVRTRPEEAAALVRVAVEGLPGTPAHAMASAQATPTVAP